MIECIERGCYDGVLNFGRMRNFCVWVIDLVILLIGMCNIIFLIDGKCNLCLFDLIYLMDCLCGFDLEFFVMLIVNLCVLCIVYLNVLCCVMNIVLVDESGVWFVYWLFVGYVCMLLCVLFDLVVWFGVVSVSVKDELCCLLFGSFKVFGVLIVLVWFVKWLWCM